MNLGNPAIVRSLAALALLSAGAGALAGSGDGPPDLRDQASRLPAKQLAGQRIIASYPGTKPPRPLVKMIRRGQVAGVIFFAENVTGRAQLARVSARLQRAREQASLPKALRAPLLLMTDQEGGEVRRLPGAPTRSQKEVGRSADPGRSARRAGRGAAKNLSRAGINVNLAPVLGVNRKGGGFLNDTGRTYGRRPSKVGTLAARFIREHGRRGVAATAKHFPGLGAARVSTDQSPVTIRHSRRSIRKTDISPYRRAIGAAVELVMLSNATYPAFDEDRPAALSPTIIAEELRERLGFEGVTITDALEVPSLDAFGPVAKRGLLAAKADSDLLLFASREAGDARVGWKRMVRALRNGKLERDPALDSAARVLALRAKLAP